MQTSRHQKKFALALLLLIGAVIIIVLNLAAGFGLMNGGASGLVAIGVMLCVAYVIKVVFQS